MKQFIYYTFILLFSLYKAIYKLSNTLFIGIGVLMLMLFKLCYSKNTSVKRYTLDNLIKC